MHSTYGIKDLNVVITHPALGQLTLNGAALDNITFAFAEEGFVQDWAADGSTMTSKQEANHGTVAITVLQTSEAHKWLTRAYNYVNGARLSESAKFALLATGSDMQVTHEGKNMAIQKRADKPYQAQGQKITWTLLAGTLIER